MNRDLRALRRYASALALAVAGCGAITASGALGCGPAPGPKRPAAPPAKDGGAPDPDERAFIDCTKGFRVEFPTTATSPLSHETLDTEPRAEMVMRTGAGIGFSVTWTELPPQKLGRTAAIILHEIAKARLGATGVLDDERELLLPGGEALELAFHRADGTKERAASGRLLLFLRGATLFQVAAMGDPGAGARPDAAMFVSSFRLISCRQD